MQKSVFTSRNIQRRRCCDGRLVGCWLLLECDLGKPVNRAVFTLVLWLRLLPEPGQLCSRTELALLVPNVWGLQNATTTTIIYSFLSKDCLYSTNTKAPMSTLASWHLVTTTISAIGTQLYKAIYRLIRLRHCMPPT